MAKEVDESERNNKIMRIALEIHSESKKTVKELTDEYIENYRDIKY